MMQCSSFMRLTVGVRKVLRSFEFLSGSRWSFQIRLFRFCVKNYEISKLVEVITNSHTRTYIHTPPRPPRTHRDLHLLADQDKTLFNDLTLKFGRTISDYSDCHLRKLKVAILKKKNIARMVLKLTVYVRNVVSFFYKPRTRVKFRCLELFWQHFQLFGYVLLKIGYFAFWPCLWRHYDVIC